LKPRWHPLAATVAAAITLTAAAAAV